MGKLTSKRRLQFSKVGTSIQPTLKDKGTAMGNRSNGKNLNFIPPMIKEGTLTVQIKEEDIYIHTHTSQGLGKCFHRLHHWDLSI